MRSPILGATTGFTSNGARYLPLTPTVAGANTARNLMEAVMPTSGTLRNLAVAVSVAPGAGNSWTFGIVKNGTIMTSLVIADTATTGIDTTGTVDYAAGDLICLSVVSAGTPSTSMIGQWSVDNDAAAGQVLSSLTPSATLSSAADNFFGLSGNAALFTSAASIAAPIPTAGTISGLRIAATAAPGASASWTATLVVNGVDTALSCILTGAGTTQATDSAHSVAVAAGDVACWRIRPTGTPATARIAVSAIFAPTIAGESIQQHAGTTTYATVSSYFTRTGVSALAASTTESSRTNAHGTAYTVRKLRATLDVAPGSGKTRTFTFRPAGVDSALTATIADLATAGASGAQDVPIAGALVATTVRLGLTSTPATSAAQWGYVTYAPSATGTATATGGGALTASAGKAAARSAAVTGAGAPTATGRKQVTAAAAGTAGGAAAAVGRKSAQAATIVTANGTVAVTVAKRAVAAGALTAGGAPAAVGRTERLSTANVTGAGALVAAGIGAEAGPPPIGAVARLCARPRFAATPAATIRTTPRQSANPKTETRLTAC